MTGRMMSVTVFLAALLHVCVGLYRPERVVNGMPVDEGASWQVSLQTNGRHYCGGSIVKGNWVLTAAHCAVAYPYPEDVRVQLGLKTLARSSQTFEVTKIIPHPKFDPSTLINDIALVKIDMPADKARTHEGQSIRTETDDSDKDPEICTVTGYGVTSYNGAMSNVLLKANVETWLQEDCKQFYIKHQATINEGHLCAGGKDKDACQGDSGGPLVCCTEDTLRTENCTLSAVVSWGFGCAADGYPGVYTKVAHFSDWIDEVTSSN